MRPQDSPTGESTYQKYQKQEQLIQMLNDANKKLQGQMASLIQVILVREEELRKAKGDCPKQPCRLHSEHVGPCDSRRG